MSYFIKILTFFCILSTFFTLSGCGSWQNDSGNANWQVPKIRSDIPFSITEPDVFSADITLKYPGGSRNLFFAKKGDISLAIYDKDTENEIALLKGEKNYLYSASEQKYTELADPAIAENFSQFTEDMLNVRSDSEFESIGEENGLNRFVSRTRGSASIIYFAENAKLPVKQEFFSGLEITDAPDLTVEFSNVMLTVEDNVFQLPDKFKKVAFAEMVEK